MNYNSFSSNIQTAAFERQPGTWNNDFVITSGQAANDQVRAIGDQPAAMNYDSFNLNQGAAVENRPAPANLNEQPIALENQRGVAWPGVDEDEWEAQMETLRLSFGGDSAAKRARE